MRTQDVNYLLRLPSSLVHAAKIAAKKDRRTLASFIRVAMEERIKTIAPSAAERIEPALDDPQP